MELCEGSTAQSTAFEFVEDGFAPGLWDADTLEGVDFKDSVIRGFRRCHSRQSMTSPLFSARGVPGTAYLETAILYVKLANYGFIKIYHSVSREFNSPFSVLC